MNLPEDLDRIEQALLDAIGQLHPDFIAPRLNPALAAELFEAQVGSRLVDHTARWLRSNHGVGYYTIGSAGHESNAAVAMALRPSDPALLHYRSGGFYFGRASQLPGQDPAGDVLRGMLALTSDQIAGGRHKVFGNKALNIVPQTSTISSHLPRAVGLALSIGSEIDWFDQDEAAYPEDSLVICSLGDASLNHSTAQGAINWACNAGHRGERVPILFVVEDNGLGISVPTPDGWVAASTASRLNLEWASVDGAQPGDVYETTSELAETIRDQGLPGLLHLRTVRFLGHAGTDVESAYRSPSELRDDLARDPLLATASEVVAGGVCGADELVAWYLEQRAEMRTRALDLHHDPNECELATAKQVAEPLDTPDQLNGNQVVEALAVQLMETAAAASPEPLTLAQTINATLAAALDRLNNVVVFGEDVGRKGGVYGVTRGLQSRFGEGRVFDTILDEQSVLGMALGSGLNGFVPIPEIQYLAYLHNAADQLRGEAATLPFFSNGQYRNPMVVRIAAYAYQRGFGGHFHNDNSVAALRDIPGIVIASPSHPSDAGPMLATCIAAAATHGSVSAFLEPIARYHTNELFEEDDGRWTSPPVVQPISIGSARTHGRGTDGTILTWGNGLYLSLRASRRLTRDHGQNWRVVDLRWLAPLPIHDMIREAEATGKVLVVDETRRSGGVSEAIMAELIDAGFLGGLRRITADDCFIPLGAAAELVLVDEDRIVQAALGA